MVALFMSELNHSQNNVFRRFFPEKNASKKTDGYDFYLSADESILYKKNNFTNPQLLEIVNTEEKMQRFLCILDGSLIPNILRKHVCSGYDLEIDGSYKSEFIHGLRLDLIRSQAIDADLHSKIIVERNELFSSLKQLASLNQLTGDWALHNLIYSYKYECIINVDLEGFLSYDPLPPWADLIQIEQWLNSI
jgi:hypothetical protein